MCDCNRGQIEKDDNEALLPSERMQKTDRARKGIASRSEMLNKKGVAKTENPVIELQHFPANAEVELTDQHRSGEKSTDTKHP